MKLKCIINYNHNDIYTCATANGLISKPKLITYLVLLKNIENYKNKFCYRLVDTPCLEMHTDAFVEEAKKVVSLLSEYPSVDISIIRGEELRYFFIHKDIFFWYICSPSVSLLSYYF